MTSAQQPIVVLSLGETFDVHRCAFVLGQLLNGGCMRAINWPQIQRIMTDLRQNPPTLRPVMATDFTVELFSLSEGSELHELIDAERDAVVELLRINAFDTTVATHLDALLNTSESLDFESLIGPIDIEDLNDEAHVPYVTSETDLARLPHADALAEWQQSCCHHPLCVTRYPVMYQLLQLRTPLFVCERHNFTTVQATHAAWRYVHYRHSARVLGYSVRQELPHCFIIAIRNRFPDPAGHYVGYKEKEGYVAGA